MELMVPTPGAGIFMKRAYDVNEEPGPLPGSF